jgi:hypothetical protein
MALLGRLAAPKLLRALSVLHNATRVQSFRRLLRTGAPERFNNRPPARRLRALLSALHTVARVQTALLYRLARAGVRNHPKRLRALSLLRTVAQAESRRPRLRAAQPQNSELEATL